MQSIAIVIYNKNINLYCVVDGRNRIAIMKRLNFCSETVILAYKLDHNVDIPKVFMHIAGHMSNRQSNARFRENFFDKVNLCRKILASQTCNNLSIEKIAIILGIPNLPIF